MQNGSILKFSEKSPMARGLFAKIRLSSSLRQRAPAWRLPGRRLATSCLLWAPRRPSRDAYRCHDAAPPFFLSPSPSLLSLLSSQPRLQARAWPPPSLATPRLPLLIRRAPELRLAALLLPAEVIEPGRLQTPPASSIPHRTRAPPSPKLLAGRPSPAKPSPPATSW
jgi:hypothetical protein